MRKKKEKNKKFKDNKEGRERGENIGREMESFEGRAGQREVYPSN